MVCLLIWSRAWTWKLYTRTWARERWWGKDETEICKMVRVQSNKLPLWLVWKTYGTLLSTISSWIEEIRVHTCVIYSGTIDMQTWPMGSAFKVFIKLSHSHVSKSNFYIIGQPDSYIRTTLIVPWPWNYCTYTILFVSKSLVATTKCTLQTNNWPS